MTVVIACSGVGVPDVGESIAKVDWDEAKQSGAVQEYVAEVKERLAPFLNNSYVDVCAGG